MLPVKHDNYIVIKLITKNSSALQNVLYSSSSDTMTAWWTGFTDPESGVKKIQTRLWSGGESCTAPNIDSMMSIVDFTELPSNASSYEFRNIILQVSGTLLWLV